MKLLAFLLIAAVAFAGDAPTRLIVKHASVSHQVWVSGANWQYVAGDSLKA